MLGKAIFARRAGHPATTSSELQLGPTVSSPSPFARKLRKLKQVFKRSSSREKDATQSIAHPRQDSQVPAHPHQDLQPMTRPSQGPYAMTQRDVASFDQRPHGPYLGLPPVLSPSPLFQPGEDILATSTRSTTSRRTFSRNPSPLAPPQSVATAPTTVRSPRPSRRFQPEEEVPTASTQSTTSRRAFSPNPSPLAPPQSVTTAPTTVRSHRSSRPFQPEEIFSATSTASTTSRPTVSPNPSLLFAPPHSFDAAPATASSRRSSLSLQPGEETSAPSTPSTTPRPSFSPNPSFLLAPPQSGDTTPTTVHSQLSHTFQDSELTVDDPAAAQKIAELRAAIAELENKRDNFINGVQNQLMATCVAGVRDFTQKRDDQVAALERAKAELAEKLEAQAELDKLWRDQREERWKLDDATVELNKERKEKEKRCEELELEVHRLCFQQRQWVKRGWRRRDWVWDSDSYAEDSSGVSAEQYAASPTSHQQSSYAGDYTENSHSQGSPAPAPISSKRAKPGLYAVGSGHGASTQSSGSTEFEMMEEATRYHPRASQPIRRTLDKSAQQHEGSGSRKGSDDYSDDFA